MSQDFLEKNYFAKRYEKARKSLRKKMKAFLSDPSEDNTHDIRTAIRRMNASLELLPKKVLKRKSASRLAKSLKKVMGETAIVRDLDTIAARISRHPQSAARKSILEKLSENREKHIKRAMELVASAKKINPPVARRKDLAGAKLQRRFTKVLADLSEKANTSLPIVLEDPTNAEEVHSLRKCCKKMRYLFELTSNEKSQVLGSLESWQDALGSIHDGDVAISFLSKMKKSGEIREMIATELRDRNHDYEKFIETSIERPR